MDLAELGSGRTRDLWLDVQPPEAEEAPASRVPGAKSRKKEEKESKHAERLHKKGKQCRMHLLVRIPAFCVVLLIRGNAQETQGKATLLAHHLSMHAMCSWKSALRNVGQGRECWGYAIQRLASASAVSQWFS